MGFHHSPVCFRTSSISHGYGWSTSDVTGGNYEKPVRLISAATVMPVEEACGEVFYDDHLGCSVVMSSTGPRAVVEVVSLASTMSKTKTYPGDDDDDPGQRTCY